MLSRKNFTKEHIEELRNSSGNDPSILERTIYAFGLLESIRKTEMPFIFKGGTVLLLLLDKPMRLSTDIDIIVAPGTDIDSYIEQAGKVFPFVSCEENIRKGGRNIEKRHYRFLFESPLTGKMIHILLDVLFEDNPYPTIEQREIRNSLLITEGDPLTVDTPSINCILGDKLTAFAPHTTGIPFGIDKELEIIKQMYDCYTLLQAMTDYNEVRRAYLSVVEKEIAYRSLQIKPEDALADTVKSCICLIGRGSFAKSEYAHYADGIRRIQGHIFSGSISGETAAVYACPILRFAASMLKNVSYTEISDTDLYQRDTITVRNTKRITYLRQVDPKAYAELVETYNLLGNEFFVLE